MKRLFVLVSCAVLLGGCAMTFPKPHQPVRPVAKVAAPAQLDANGIAIERVPFRAGVSTVTVEKLAKQYGCTGGQGAGLMTAPGPVEVYRMICESKQVFMARCEFRQCKPMAAPPPGGYGARAPMPVAAPMIANVTAARPAASPAAAPVAKPVAVAVPAPIASAAPAEDDDDADTAIPAQAPGAGKVVPRLKVRWSCGECVINEKVAPLITEKYEKIAARKGVAISDAETVEMVIVNFRPRNDAGNDPGLIGTQIKFRGRTQLASTVRIRGPGDINLLSHHMATQTYRKMLTAVRQKVVAAAPKVAPAS